MLSGMATADTAVALRATARGTTALNPFIMVVVNVVLELNMMISFVRSGELS